MQSVAVLLQRSQVWSEIVRLILANALLVASAKTQVPFYPVPMTLQTLVVLALPWIFGGRFGTAAIALYLLEGVAGLPVFAGTPERGIGLVYMVGPTGGFLAGFLLAAPLTGHLVARGFGRGIVGAFGVAALGHAVIQLAGLAWLGSFTGYGSALMAVGLWPFLLSTAAKTGLAALMLPTLKQLWSR